MTPAIEHLKENYLLDSDRACQNIVEGTFVPFLENCSPDFYRKLVRSHLDLVLEYSLLGQTLADQLNSTEICDIDQVLVQTKEALILGQLLKHLHQQYLIVPREVKRLDEQKQLYINLLMSLDSDMERAVSPNELVDVGASLSQKVRFNTMMVNLYRLLIIRTKRALDLISMLGQSSDGYRHFVRVIDKYTDPILPHIGWFFYLPRLSVNLFLLAKHTIPGFWMQPKEKDLGWVTRFQAQIKRRWFELANDSTWVAVGLVNCFLLTGAMAPVGVYLTIAFFGFDVLLSAVRAYIELSRLTRLEIYYQDARDRETDWVKRKQIDGNLLSIRSQINFERLRLGSHIATTSVIFLAMCCAAPLFMANPLISLIGAICLVMVCLLNFVLVQFIEYKRPKDMIDESQIRFFAQKKSPLSLAQTQPDLSETESETEDLLSAPRR